MLDPLAQRVRQELLAYLAGQSSLRDLWRWLQMNVVATGVERTNPEVRVLTGPMLLYLYEYSNHHRTEDELRRLFFPILTSYPIAGSLEPAASVSTSARVTGHLSYSIAA